MLEKNRDYRVIVEGYTSEGMGVCRVEGRAVFVPGAIAGEDIVIRTEIVGQHTAYAKIVNIVSPSKHRCEADCPYAADCGGCSFWHMRYEEELRLKRQRVLDAFERIGGIRLPELEIHGGNSLVRYRNKVQFPVGKREGKLRCGFYRKKTHEIIDIRDCLIQSETAREVKKAVLEFCRRHAIAAYDEQSNTGVLRHIYVRVAHATGQVLVCLVINAERLPAEKTLLEELRQRIPALKTLLINTNRRRTNVVLGEQMRILFGDGYIEDILCGLRFRLSARSFYQVNSVQAERLYRLAIEQAQLCRSDTVLDLYCGTGTISLCMASAVKQVIGVELIADAVADAGENAARNGIQNARFLCADAGKAAQQLASEGIRPDVIVVDPPRKGLSADVIHAMLQLAPERIVYISCDPATCARDVKLLTEGTYCLQTAQAVDMFPRCSHVETVASLSRK